MLEERVRTIMSKVFNVPSSEITDASSNETIERWDSLGHMNLCLALEEEFGIELDGDNVASMTKYPDVVTVVRAAVESR